MLTNLKLASWYSPLIGVWPELADHNPLRMVDTVPLSLIGSMSPWVLPDRTQGTFRQYPGRHRPYQRHCPLIGVWLELADHNPLRMVDTVPLSSDGSVA